MVVNPIYETGAIYEEIPDPSIYKSRQPTATDHEKEEGYVSISSSVATNTSTSGKCFLVRVCVYSAHASCE